MSNTELAGIPIAEIVPVYAAPIEGHGLEDLGVVGLGVGKVAAALRCSQLLQARSSAQAVLLFGVAGAYPARHRDEPPPVSVGDLAVVGRDQLGDEGVQTPDGFFDLGAMRLGDCGPFVADPRLAQVAAERLQAPCVDAVTVSCCSGTDELSRQLRARSCADLETMEGAAVATVCRHFEVPLLQLRAVSNWTGDRSRGEWNLGAAVDIVQRAVRRLLQP